MNGYRELRESAAWIDLSARGRIRAAGDDRARLLHAMTTNHVQELTPGRGVYAFFLNAQGRILGDVNLLCLEDAILLDTEPETGGKLLQHLDRYIIADDVTLEDVTARTAAIAVEGPEAAAVLRQIGAPVPQDMWSSAPWGDRLVARLSRTGQPGWWILAPANEKQPIAGSLGVPEAPEEAVRTVRIENGVPRYGEDFSEANLPQETQLMHAIHFNKGCYIGQEIVERVRSRGHINRLLVRLAIESQTPPQPGAKVLAEGAEAGTISSAAWSPACQVTFAFAWLRSEHASAPSRIPPADARGSEGFVVSRDREGAVHTRAKAEFTVDGSRATIAASAPAVPSGPTGCP